MQKVLIGCLGLLFVVAIAGGSVAYFKFIKPGWEFASGIAELGTEFKELNESVEQPSSSFSAPSDGALDESTFQRFLETQRQMRGQLEGRLTELQEKYKQLDEEIEERGGQASISDMMGGYADLTNLLIDAKRAQVNALNAQNFSLAEYNWARERIYRAIGESVAVAAIAENPAATGRFQQTVPQETIDMVEPHRQELMESHVLAWWGL